MKHLFLLTALLLALLTSAQSAKIDKTQWVVVEKKGPIETDIWGILYDKDLETGVTDSFVYKNISVRNLEKLKTNYWRDRMDELRIMKARYQNTPMYLMVDKSLFYAIPNRGRGIETVLTTLSFDSLTYVEMVNYINSNDTTLKYFKILGKDTELKKSVEKKIPWLITLFTSPKNLIYPIMQEIWKIFL